MQALWSKAAERTRDGQVEARANGLERACYRQQRKRRAAARWTMRRRPTQSRRALVIGAVDPQSKPGGVFAALGDDGENAVHSRR